MSAGPKLPPTSYAVLGLLSLVSASGYDLSQMAEASIANFWPLSRSQIYSELTRLEDLGLVSGTEVSQERLPDKRVFELTDAGFEELDGWLDAPGAPADRYRSGFLLKAFFGSRMDPTARIALLDAYRAEAVEARDRLGLIAGQVSKDPALAFTAATARLGQLSADAAVRWCDEVRPLFEGRRTGRRSG